jgi:hypothetical protein
MVRYCTIVMWILRRLIDFYLLSSCTPAVMPQEELFYVLFCDEKKNDISPNRADVLERYQYCTFTLNGHF